MLNQINSTAPQGKIPDVYTPSLTALNESIAMEGFNNFVKTSSIAQDSDEITKIALYLEHLSIQKKQK